MFDSTLPVFFALFHLRISTQKQCVLTSWRLIVTFLLNALLSILGHSMFQNTKMATGKMATYRLKTLVDKAIVDITVTTSTCIQSMNWTRSIQAPTVPSGTDGIFSDDLTTCELQTLLLIQMTPFARGQSESRVGKQKWCWPFFAGMQEWVIRVLKEWKVDSVQSQSWNEIV